MPLKHPRAVYPGRGWGEFRAGGMRGSGYMFAMREGTNSLTHIGSLHYTFLTLKYWHIGAPLAAPLAAVLWSIGQAVPFLQPVVVLKYGQIMDVGMTNQESNRTRRAWGKFACKKLQSTFHECEIGRFDAQNETDYSKKNVLQQCKLLRMQLGLEFDVS